MSVRMAGTLVLLAGLVVSGTSHAERAWVKDELSLNLRTGPGVQFRIIGTIATGDSLDVLSRGDGWTHVKANEDLQGWIPEGYLQPEPPAGIQLARQEDEVASMRTGFGELQSEVTGLRTDNERLVAREQELQQQVEELTRENLELRAGARWPEWIAGASILGVGGLLGLFISWSAGRRSPRRIRL